MYNLFTKWITLAMLFFLINYTFDFIEVVTLGGLVAGSFMIAAWTVAVCSLTKKLPKFTGKATVCAAVILGVQALGNVLPGYKVEASGELVVFLICYSALAILIGNFLDSEV